MLKLMGKKPFTIYAQNFVYRNMCKSISLITLEWLETPNLAHALIIDPTENGRSAKALAKLRGRAGSPESSLFAYAISTQISLACSYCMTFVLYLLYQVNLHCANVYNPLTAFVPKIGDCL